MKLINDQNRKWWTLGTVCFTLLMIVLDGNVVNLAIPRILKDFNATLSQIEWINNAYLLTFAIFLITFGRLGDELGRKKLFISGLVTFLIGSILCGIASNIDQLVIFRVIQGLGGAAMMPATLSLIAANFEKKERGSAMGAWGAVAGLGIVLGPIVGGYLTDKGLGTALNDFFHISQYWRYVFFINAPLGIIALIAAARVIPESKDREKSHKIDFPGIILSALSIFLLTFGFIEGTKYGWWNVNETVSLFGHNLAMGNISIIPLIFLASIIFAWIFVIVEKKCVKDPLVDLKLFTKRNFSVGNLTAMILSFGMMGSFFLLPLFLQIVMGFAPIKTGQVLLPFAISIMIMAPISGMLADKIGGKMLVAAGLFIMSIGGYLLGQFTVDTTISQLIFPFIVMGVGMGLCQAPLTNITLLETPEDEVGGASGVLSTARQIGSVMGIAILGAFLQTIMADKIKTNINTISGLPESAKVQIIDSIASQGLATDMSKFQLQLQKDLVASVPPAQLQSMKPEQLAQSFAKIGAEIGISVKKSFVESINQTFHVAALIALLGSITALFFKGKKKEDLA